MAASARSVRAESPQDRDKTPQAGAVSLLPATKRILEMIAAGASLTDILTSLCAAIDDQNPDMMSMAMLMDPDGQRMWPAAAPRMPRDFVKAISPLMIGENMASCGTAAFRKERVILPDVATDPLMSDLPAGTREFVLAQGIRAQWSQPLLSKDNEGLGTFGLFHGTPRSPTGRQLRLIEDAANIAVIAIEGERSQAALSRRCTLSRPRNSDFERSSTPSPPKRGAFARMAASPTSINAGMSTPVSRGKKCVAVGRVSRGEQRPETTLPKP